MAATVGLQVASEDDVGSTRQGLRLAIAAKCSLINTLEPQSQVCSVTFACHVSLLNKKAADWGHARIAMPSSLKRKTEAIS